MGNDFPVFVYEIGRSFVPIRAGVVFFFDVGSTLRTKMLNLLKKASRDL
jgi:hypothetical protein